MRLPSIVLVILIAISATKFTEAQEQNEWIPQSIGTLQQSASSKTKFTFDHSMLVLASKLERDDEDLRRVIAGISGISVHRYHFPGSWQYDQGALISVIEEYRSAGWKRLINSHAKGEDPGATDLWVRIKNNAISNIAILLASSE
jgi:hypothetical protein